MNPYTDFAFKLLFGTELNKELVEYEDSLKSLGVAQDVIIKSTGLTSKEIEKL